MTRHGIAGLIAAWVFLMAPVDANAQENTYREWMRQQQKDYQAFASEQDKAFLTYLERRWEDVVVRPPDRFEVGPKPAQIPTANESRPSGVTRIPVQEPVTAQNTNSERLGGDPRLGEEAAKARDVQEEQDLQNPTVSTPPAPMPPASSATEIPTTTRSLPFLGADLSMAVPDGLVVPLPSRSVGETLFREYWRSQSRTPYGPLVSELKQRRDAMRLGDWGYYLLVRDVAQMVYGRSEQAPVLFTWFLMAKSGYAARAGYTEEGQVYLMLPSDDQALKLPQFRIGGQRHYIIVPEGATRQIGTVRTYDGQYPGATRKIDFDLPEMPTARGATGRRTLTFEFQGQQQEIPIAYDEGVLQYLTEYPKTELSVYFRAGISPVARQSLLGALRPMLRDRSDIEAANLLLRFVQRSFDYKRDRDHVGEERYLFPEQTLAAEYSDCEDRAALYAYLARELLGADVIGLKYPGHVAAAIRLPQWEGAVRGNVVDYQGSQYLVADPTYFGADVGMIMPFFKDDAPQVIALKP